MADFIQDHRGELVLSISNDLSLGLHPDENRSGSVTKFFKPLTGFLRLFGFFMDPDKDGCDNLWFRIVRGLQLLYGIGMWMWTIMMSVNIFYMALVVTTMSGIDPTNGLHANMIVTLVEESPYSFVTVRNAVILTTFFTRCKLIQDGIATCEALDRKIQALGRKSAPVKDSNFHPLQFMLAAILLILLWEGFQWSMFLTLWGMEYLWNMQPFPFKLLHYIYSSLWWAFTTIPFLFSQIALCFPLCFAHHLKRFCCFMNEELAELARSAERPEVQPFDFSKRVVQLRKLHFDIREVLHKVDKAVRRMLLQQFIFDVVILFGFLGLLINSKDCKPRKELVEVIFFVVTSLVWFLFFLLCFSVPLIRMATEAEKTLKLVQALTLFRRKLTKEAQDDICLFLQEVRNCTIAFTGDNFYYINRHYIVTCIAVVTSYIIVLAEVLERFYGTEHLKEQISTLSKFVQNATWNSAPIALH